MFLTGVAYTDANGDHFYTPGEGRGGPHHVDLRGVADGRTFAAIAADDGDYEVAAAAGTYDVALSGGGLGAARHVTLAIGSANVKLDLIDADGIASSASVALGANLKAATLLGTAVLNATGNALDNVLSGNVGNNMLDGGAGADSLRGGAGSDVFVLEAGEANGDRLQGSAGADHFVFRSLSERGDTIVDFNAAAGDRVDLSPLLHALGYHGPDPIGDGMVELVQSYRNVLVEVHTSPDSSETVVLATLAHTSMAAVGDDFLIG